MITNYERAVELLENADPAGSAYAALALIDAVKEFTEQLHILYNNFWELQLRNEQNR